MSTYNTLEAKHLGLWLALRETIDKLDTQAIDYIRQADEMTESDPLNSVNLRGQAIGLKQAIIIIGEILRNRDLLT